MMLNVYAIKIGPKAFGVPFYAENHSQAVATIVSIEANFDFRKCPVFFLGVYDTNDAHITPNRKPVKVSNNGK